MAELSEIALRAAVVYAFLLLLMRLLGKRAITSLTAFDLLVALMMGELIDEVVYGNASMAEGAVALLTIAAAHYATSWIGYWDHGAGRWLEGRPVEIVRDGTLDHRGMRRERMNEREVLAELRLHGVSDLREVKLAQVENDGQVSVLLHDWAEAAHRADVDAPAARQRDEQLGRGAPHTTVPPPEGL